MFAIDKVSSYKIQRYLINLSLKIFSVQNSLCDPYNVECP